MNFEYSASRWIEATHTYARVPTHIHTHTHIHTDTHARARIHKQDVTLHILVSDISSEGAVDCHSGVSPDEATAQFHVTNFVNRCVAGRGNLIRFITLNHFLHIFREVMNWIFLKKDLSLDILLGKTAGKQRRGRINKNRNVDRNAYRKIKGY